MHGASRGTSHQDEPQLQQPSSHHPSAPSHESFDISTTVDPGYVISLIRKLLPSYEKDGEHAAGSALVCEPNAESTKLVPANLPQNGGEAEAMEYSENYGKVSGQEPTNDYKNTGESVGEQAWEEFGCVLWDLAASEDHAQFMVQNLILQVLLANLVVPQSPRITEISVGIIGNLACHEISRKQIASVNGLVGAIVEQLFLDDVPCLCEVCSIATTSSQLVSLLQQLTIGSDSSLHEYIKELEPFPEFDILDDIRRFHQKIRETYSPRVHLLKLVKRSHNVPPRLLLCRLHLKIMEL